MRPLRARSQLSCLSQRETSRVAYRKTKTPLPRRKHFRDRPLAHTALSSEISWSFIADLHRRRPWFLWPLTRRFFQCHLFSRSLLRRPADVESDSPQSDCIPDWLLLLPWHSRLVLISLAVNRQVCSALFSSRCG